jgi:hypothetical protein
VFWRVWSNAGFRLGFSLILFLAGVIWSYVGRECVCLCVCVCVCVPVRETDKHLRVFRGALVRV